MNYEVGQIIFAQDPIVVNEGRDTIELIVNNTGDRSIQVCSHYHFFEANIALRFDLVIKFFILPCSVCFNPHKLTYVTISLPLFFKYHGITCLFCAI